MHSPTEAHRQKLREALKNPNHPIRSPEAMERRIARMNDPDIKEKFLGENNPAKKPATRAKLKQLWQDPTFREKQRQARTGVSHNFSDAQRVKMAEAAKANPAMLGWDKRNGKDPEFDAKRIAGIKAAQPKRKEKMADPVALAQRKARLKATMNSEEFKAKRSAWDTPEYREKLAAAKREYWAKKRMTSQTP